MIIIVAYYSCLKGLYRRGNSCWWQKIMDDKTRCVWIKLSTTIYSEKSSHQQQSLSSITKAISFWKRKLKKTRPLCYQQPPFLLSVSKLWITKVHCTVYLSQQCKRFLLSTVLLFLSLFSQALTRRTNYQQLNFSPVETHVSNIKVHLTPKYFFR